LLSIELETKVVAVDVLRFGDQGIAKVRVDDGGEAAFGVIEIK
jgi:hypothetical protein